MGFAITSNSLYNPMSFEEKIKPFQMMTDEYRLLEEEISKLETEALTVRELAEKEPDAEYAKKYNAYADELSLTAELLAQKGLKSVNRKALYDLRNQYQTNVKPIEDADKYIKEKAKEQQALNNAAKGRLRFDVNFSDPSIMQRVIDSNNTLGYNVYDLDKLNKDAVIAGSTIAASKTPTVIEHPDSPQYNIITQGLSAEEMTSLSDEIIAAKAVISNPSSTAVQIAEAQAILNNNPIEREVQKVLADVPENIRAEIENDVRNNIMNSALGVPKLEINKNFITDREKSNMRRLEAQLDLNEQKLQQQMDARDMNYEWKTLGKIPDKNPDGSYKRDDNGRIIFRYPTTDEAEAIQLKEKQKKAAKRAQDLAISYKKYPKEYEKEYAKSNLNIVIKVDGDTYTSLEDETSFNTTGKGNRRKKGDPLIPIAYTKLTNGFIKSAVIKKCEEVGIDPVDTEVYIDNKNNIRIVGIGYRDSEGNILKNYEDAFLDLVIEKEKVRGNLPSEGGGEQPNTAPKTSGTPLNFDTTEPAQ